MSRLPWPAEGGVVSRAYKEAHENCEADTGIVILAAGQSNMEWPVKDTVNRGELARAIRGKDIRWLMVPRKDYPSMAEMTPFVWQKLDENNLDQVSGVGLYAALQLAQYTDLPIGLVGCYRGGSSAASWVDRNRLESHEGIRQYYITDYEADILDQSDEEEDVLRAQYDRSVAEYEARFAACEKAHPELDRSQLKALLGHTPFPGPKGKKDFLRPSGLYETMGVRLQGLMPDVLLWYQGEEDTKAAGLYEALLGMAVDTWKEITGRDMPVVIAQLPGYNDVKAGHDWGTVRLAQQHYADRQENTALVCLLDAGDHDNIHPQDKKKPGIRMGEAAASLLHLTEAMPYPRAVSAQGDAVTLSDGRVIQWPEPSYGLDNDPNPVLAGENSLPVLPFEKDAL